MWDGQNSSTGWQQYESFSIQHSNGHRHKTPAIARCFTFYTTVSPSRRKYMEERRERVIRFSSDSTSFLQNCMVNYVPSHICPRRYVLNPNMNGIEIPDPYCESELRQRLGIATYMCYNVLESPEQVSNNKNRRFCIFVPQLEFSMFQTVDVQKGNGSTRHPFFKKWIGYPGRPWWRSLVACVG